MRSGGRVVEVLSCAGRAVEDVVVAMVWVWERMDLIAFQAGDVERL